MTKPKSFIGGGNPFISNDAPPTGIQDILDKSNIGGGLPYFGGGIGGNGFSSELDKVATPAEATEPAPPPPPVASPAFSPPPTTSAQQAQSMVASAKSFDPVKLVGRNFYDLPKSTQQLVLASYEDAGYSPQDVEGIIRKGLPQAAGRAGSRVM